MVTGLGERWLDALARIEDPTAAGAASTSSNAPSARATTKSELPGLPIRRRTGSLPPRHSPPKRGERFGSMQRTVVVPIVFPDPGHGYEPGALLLGLRPPVPLGGCAPRRRPTRPPSAVDPVPQVIVAVRDDAAKGLYEETLFRWTPAGAGLNEDERSFLQAIQASRRHPDPDEIGKWLGWEEAHEIEARLRSRLHRPPARIDRYTIHFADRLDDSDIGL